MTEASDNICFVIAPIGDEGSDIRKRSDQVFNHIITPAAQTAGMSTLRADKIEESGLITSQVIQRIVNSKLVIADLTGANPNVYYELAIRHAIRKLFVQIIERGAKLPFDVAGVRTVYIDHKDLDAAAQARDDICSLIKAVLSKSEPQESPISIALNLQVLKASENPEERGIGELLSTVHEIRADLASGNLFKSDQLVGDIQAIIQKHTSIVDRSGTHFKMVKLVFQLFEARRLTERSSASEIRSAILVLSRVIFHYIPWVDVAVQQFCGQAYSEDLNTSKIFLRKIIDRTWELFSGEDLDYFLDDSIGEFQKLIELYFNQLKLEDDIPF